MLGTERKDENLSAGIEIRINARKTSFILVYVEIQIKAEPAQQTFALAMALKTGFALAKCPIVCLKTWCMVGYVLD